MASLEQAEALVRRRMAECDPELLGDCSAAEVLRRSELAAEALQDYWKACREVGRGCGRAGSLVNERGKG